MVAVSVGGVGFRDAAHVAPVQPPAVHLTALAGADLLQARAVVHAAPARAVRVVRRRAGVDAGRVENNVASGGGLWYNFAQTFDDLFRADVRARGEFGRPSMSSGCFISVYFISGDYRILFLVNGYDGPCPVKVKMVCIHSG